MRLSVLLVVYGTLYGLYCAAGGSVRALYAFIVALCVYLCACAADIAIQGYNWPVLVLSGYDLHSADAGLVRLSGRIFGSMVSCLTW